MNRLPLQVSAKEFKTRIISLGELKDGVFLLIFSLFVVAFCENNLKVR